MAAQKAVIVGISGRSSSGKTTLARLLRDIFPSTFILHQDDFYKPDSEIPVRDGLQDWDCPEAISIPTMEKALSHIRTTATFPVRSHWHLSARSSHGLPRSFLPLRTAPAKSYSAQPDLDSKEDQNQVGKCPVSDEKIAAMRDKVAAWRLPDQPGHGILGEHGLKMCLLDGFLLYCQEMKKVQSLIDIKLFLLVSREKATQRREARDGYVTLEGFWQDPPGYLDKIVWPNYAAAHSWLFVDGNVEGQLDEEVLRSTGIQAQVGKDQDITFEETLEWAVDRIMEGLVQIASKDKSQ